jgi:hypothetical protein
VQKIGSAHYLLASQGLLEFAFVPRQILNHARCCRPGSHDGLDHDDMSSAGVDLEQLPWTKKIRTIAWLVAVCSRKPGARHSGIPPSLLAVERTGAATNTTPSRPPPTPVRPHLARIVPSRHHQQRESTHRRTCLLRNRCGASDRSGGGWRIIDGADEAEMK